MRSLASIAPVILAAGNSARMGYPKPLLPLGTETFLTRILRIIREAGLPDPCIVLGKASAMIQERIRGWPADIRINPDPDRGQLSSIQLALSTLRPEYEAALIWPVDHPAVSGELVRALTQLYMSSRSLIVCPLHEGRRGHPAIFHRDLFREFMDEPLQEGPKRILTRHLGETSVWPTGEAAVVRDIDTPLDYEELTGESLELALQKRGLEADLQL